MRLRRAGIPREVAAGLDLRPGERLLGWAHVVDPDPASSYLVATDRALHVPEPVGWGRVPWDLVVRASWDEPVLDVVAQPAPGGRPRTARLVLDDPRDLVHVVHAQVTASVLVQQRLDLGDGRAATAVARRVADTGATRWAVTFDRGVDSRDPHLRAAADVALRDLRSSLGL